MGRQFAERQRAKSEWDTNPDGHALAATPGGSKIHRPTCSYITSTLRIAEACLHGDESKGNVSHPHWVAAEQATCQLCRQP